MTIFAPFSIKFCTYKGHGLNRSDVSTNQIMLIANNFDLQYPSPEEDTNCLGIQVIYNSAPLPFSTLLFNVYAETERIFKRRVM